jgi:hypothetical protein
MFDVLINSDRRCRYFGYFSCAIDGTRYYSLALWLITISWSRRG